MRPEIQGLRAVAVLAVVLFHVWPDRFPGGYVGVDVFFVISGFLITSLLVREIARDGRLDFGAFYLKRMRRLLPMAALVLAATAVLVPLLLPASAWKDVSLEVVASALYVENWRLAIQAVDYLAAEDAPSPVQHYWSLSIEEQFYLFWPALLVATAWLARVAGMPLKRCLLLVLSLVVLASFATSVLLTGADPAHAYFATHVRGWE
jgi:peptidoglycan/LPS O-acetylase OafA/YrhL